MGGGHNSGATCGCAPPPAATGQSCGSAPPPAATGPSCGCTPPPAATGQSCGSAQPPAATGPSCGCAPPPAATGQSCGSAPPPAATGQSCGCAPPSAATGQSCGCGCRHGAPEEGAGEAFPIRVARLSASALCLFAAIALPHIAAPAEAVRLALFVGAYLLAGADIVWRALRRLRRGGLFDENLLMVVASVGAFLIGEQAEGVAVMLFYQIGELLQDRAIDQSRRAIDRLLSIRPDYANRLTADGEERVSPEAISPGERILVKPGERLPLDGRVIDGRSALDTAAVTGEASPWNVAAGDAVYSGSVNLTGLLTVEVTKSFGESTVNRILALVEEAESRKAPTERFITRFARYYTPAVVAGALLLAALPPLLAGQSFADWLYRALIFLVASCPCALVISIPLGFFGGIGAASKQGILVKGGNYLEALGRVKLAVFDKTGTLTEGVFRVQDIRPQNPEEEDELLEMAALAEQYSSHPIARALSEYADARSVTIDAPGRVTDYREQAGNGVTATIDGFTVAAGNIRLMEQIGVTVPDDFRPVGTTVHVARGERYLGCITVGDRLKTDAAQTMEALKGVGVRKTVLLTGDQPETASEIGRALCMDEAFGGLLPEDKAAIVERLKKTLAPGEKLMFVGDGINDAPVIAGADIGVAMGALGSDAAIEAADVVLMTDEPSKLIGALRIAAKTRAVVRQNIVFALGVKAVVLLLGALGIATMWAAVFADIGVALIAIVNSLRVLHTGS